MNRESIIRIAQEAGFEQDMFGIGIWDSPEFNRFVALIASYEREECAKICDNEQVNYISRAGSEWWVLKTCAERIRNRDKQ